MLNRNKRGITIDLVTERGRELLLELVAVSDVVAENFTPRVLRNLGLDYERLREVNPRIILLSSTGFGQTGPWRNYKAYVFPRGGWLMSGTDSATRSLAPAFGEHTREVLSEVLGLTEYAIDELERDGVIAAAPRAGLISARQLDLDGMFASRRLLEIDEDFRARLAGQFDEDSRE